MSLIKHSHSGAGSKGSARQNIRFTAILPPASGENKTGIPKRKSIDKINRASA
jgi:hypothetical protein